MRITVQTNDLKRCLSVVSRGVSSRPQLPILSGVLLKVIDDEVNLISTDLELGFWTRLPAKIEEVGDVVVPARLFGDLVASLPPGSVEISSSKNMVKIASKGISSDLVGQSADDYPSIPRFKEHQLVVSGGDFRQKSDRVCVSAARDDTRPMLTGVLWEIDKENVLLVATDGYRLGLDKLIAKKTAVEKKTKFILPAKSMQEVSKTLSEVEVDSLGVEFDQSNQQVIFSLGDIEISSRLIVGEFPPYQQIMPNTYTVKVSMDREIFWEAVKRASLFARDGSNIVKLAINNESIVIKAESSQVGSNSTEMEAEIEGEEVTVAFNSRYLLDYLSINSAKTIVWETEGELKPSVLRRDDGSDWLQIIMPVRVQD